MATIVAIACCCMLPATSSGATGALTPIGVVANVPGVGTGLIAISPAGDHAYVASYSSETVTVFDRAASGALTSAAGPFPIDAEPSSMTVSPDGANLYLTSFQSDAVTTYSIADAGDSITPVGVPLQVGADPTALAISPDGAHAYVTSASEDTVTTFHRSASGTLTPAGSPMTVRSMPAGVVVSADGAQVYITNWEDGWVTSYARGGDGSLTSDDDNSAFAAHEPAAAVHSTDGASIYVMGTFDHTITHVARSDAGALTTSEDHVDTDGVAASAALSPDGRHLYVVDLNSGDVGLLTRTRPMSDLSIDVTGPAALDVGAEARLSMVVRNNGNAAADGVTVFMPIGAHDSLVGTGTSSACRAAVGGVSCSLGRMPVGQSHVLAVTIRPGMAGLATWAGVVTAKLQDDPSGFNNTSGVVAMVSAPPPADPNPQDPVDPVDPPHTETDQCANLSGVQLRVPTGMLQVGTQCIGSRRADRIRGTKGPDRIFAGRGHDIVRGLGGRDWIDGGQGNDRLEGNGGPDTLFGRTGNDRLIGGPGNDHLHGGPGRDVLLGGPGNDRLDARDGRGGDVVNCGPGARDIALVDRGDRVSGCERVVVVTKKSRKPMTTRKPRR